MLTKVILFYIFSVSPYVGFVSSQVVSYGRKFQDLGPIYSTLEEGANTINVLSRVECGGHCMKVLRTVTILTLINLKLLFFCFRAPALGYPMK